MDLKVLIKFGKEYIEHYIDNFHIILPILPGHNPNKKENFISFKESAKEIKGHIISRYGNHVLAIYGMSMSDGLAAYIWQNRKLDIDKVILESSPLVSYNKMMTFIMTKQYFKT